jgi:DNA-binding PadR family transcriptional regulator
MSEPLRFRPLYRRWIPNTALANYNVSRYIMRCYSERMQPRAAHHTDDLPSVSPQVFHILLALAPGDRHGYAIIQDVLDRTDGRLRLSAGTLYGSIKRMLEQGLIAELSDNERPADDDERRRYYKLTASGRKVVRAEAGRMSTLLRQARAYGLAPKRA